MRLTLWTFPILLLALALPLIWQSAAKSRTSENIASFTLDRPDVALKVTDPSDTLSGEILAFDSAESYYVQLEANDQPALLHVTSLRYNEGNSYLSRDLHEHTPEICLPTSGGKLLSGPIIKRLTLEGQEVVVEEYIFQHPSQPTPLHLYKLIWISSSGANVSAYEANRWRRAFDLLTSPSASPAGYISLVVLYGDLKQATADQIFYSHLERYCRTTVSHPKLSTETQEK